MFVREDVFVLSELIFLRKLIISRLVGEVVAGQNLRTESLELDIAAIGANQRL